MGARGRGTRGRPGKRQQKNKSKPKRERKTYGNKKQYTRKSYYGNNNQKPQEKRKYENNENNICKEPKKTKNNEEPILKQPVYTDSEEEIDPMTQLRSTFQNVKNKYGAESSDDTEQSDEEVSNKLIELNRDADEEKNGIYTIEEEGGSKRSEDEVEEEEYSNSSEDEEEEERDSIGSEDEEEEGDSNGSEDEEEKKLDVKDNQEKQMEIDNNDDEEIDDTQEDLNDNLDSIDPFANHLLHELNESLLNSVQSVPMITTTFTEEWSYLGMLVTQIPNCEEKKIEKKQYSIEEEQIFAPPGKIPKRIHLSKDTLDSLCIKSQIVDNLAKSNTSLVNQNRSIPLTPLQAEIFSVVNNYQDLYYPQRTFDNGEEIRYVYCLHVVNHILKTRTKVIHHNARLSKKDDVPEEFRDQGLVRPKVLIIAPFRDSAYKIVQFLINILFKEDKGNVINKIRFMEDFTGNELVLPKKNPKPEDYELTFAGNSGDDFRIGITVTKKSLKLYADFYSADIIIASPLGLRYTIGAEGESERNYDFLASIELLIFDQAEIFLMQNWDHVLHLMNHIHLQPKDSHGTDFSRVRTWSLNGWAKYYRQTLIFSSMLLPEINAIFNKRCFNYAGKVKAVKQIERGSILQVYVQLPHVFQKINANSIEHSIDVRFNFFITKVLPRQKDVLMKQTLIYITSYFDYVKLRNYFKKEDINFVQICEYSKTAKVARARDMFFHGDGHFLLYTERHHFFNRIRLKGIRHLVFYQPPNFPNFYYELCNFMQEANMNRKIGSMSNMTVTVLYTKYDIQQLAEVVGTERAGKMMQSEKNVHLLVTDGD